MVDKGRCIAMSRAAWDGVELAAGLFEGDPRWHALMSIGAERLSEYQTSFPTEEGARAGAYIGLRIYLDIIKNLAMPPFESLTWAREADGEEWATSFYQKPIWP
jgi:hypothetical protein